MRQAEPNTSTRRGLYAFTAVAAGILIADAIPTVPAPVWFAAACAAVITAGLIPRRFARAPLAVAALFLGAGSMSARVLTLPHDRLAVTSQAQLLLVRGTVLTPPRPDATPQEWEPPPHSPGPPVRIDLAIDSALLGPSWQDASGRIAVFVRAPRLDVAPGQRIQATGRFRAVAGPANPGQPDARRWAAQDGRVGSLSVETADAIEITPEEPALQARVQAAVSASLAALHQRASDAMDAALGPATDDAGEQSRALLRAMIIGDEDPTLRPVSDDMSRLGIVHILSISGFHLVLVAAVVVFIIRLTGDRGVWEYALSACAIGLYLLVVPAQAPVVRSGVMVLTLLITEAAGRRYDRLNILAWTACALALWRPLDIYSPGFQLSFGVTAALIWRAGAWSEAAAASGLLGMPGVKGRTRREPETVRQWIGAHITGLATATAIAWCVSSAIVAHHTGVLSLSGVLAGVVLTIPSVIAIGAGFVAMLTAAVWPAAGEPIGAVALFFSDLTVRGSHAAAQFPASSMHLPQVPLAWTIATTTVAVAAIAPGAWRRPGTRAAVLACTLWLAGIMLAAAWPIGSATIDRFALPGSSATLVRAADQSVLIDPGSNALRTGAFTLRRAVAASGSWRTRTVLLTGPQTERFAHLPELVRALGVETVLLPAAFEHVASSRPGGDQARLLRRLREQGVSVRPLAPGEGVTIGGVTITPTRPGSVEITSDGEAPRPLDLTPLEQAAHEELPAPRAP